MFMPCGDDISLGDFMEVDAFKFQAGTPNKYLSLRHRESQRSLNRIW